MKTCDELYEAIDAVPCTSPEVLKILNIAYEITMNVHDLDNRLKRIEKNQHSIDHARQAKTE